MSRRKQHSRNKKNKRTKGTMKRRYGASLVGGETSDSDYYESDSDIGRSETDNESVEVELPEINQPNNESASDTDDNSKSIENTELNQNDNESVSDRYVSDTDDEDNQYGGNGSSDDESNYDDQNNYDDALSGDESNYEDVVNNLKKKEAIKLKKIDVDDEADKIKVDGEANKIKVDGEANKIKVDDEANKIKVDDEADKIKVDDDEADKIKVDDEAENMKVDDEAENMKVDDEADKIKVDDEADKEASEKNKEEDINVDAKKEDTTEFNICENLKVKITHIKISTWNKETKQDIVGKHWYLGRNLILGINNFFEKSVNQTKDITLVELQIETDKNVEINQINNKTDSRIDVPKAKTCVVLIYKMVNDVIHVLLLYEIFTNVPYPDDNQNNVLKCMLNKISDKSKNKFSNFEFNLSNPSTNIIKFLKFLKEDKTQVYKFNDIRDKDDQQIDI